MDQRNKYMLRVESTGIFKFVAITTTVWALAVCGGTTSALAQAANSSTPTASGANDAAAPPVKPINKRFLLSKPTAIYASPDESSAVMEHVRAGIHVDVTGLSGKWLQLKLRDGKIGYIPASAAE